MNCFAQWHLANQAASEAEDAVAAGLSTANARGNARVAPCEQQVAHARHLRAVADERFEAAMNEIRAITRTRARLRPAGVRA